MPFRPGYLYVSTQRRATDDETASTRCWNRLISSGRFDPRGTYLLHLRPWGTSLDVEPVGESRLRNRPDDSVVRAPVGDGVPAYLPR